MTSGKPEKIGFDYIRCSFWQAEIYFKEYPSLASKEWMLARSAAFLRLRSGQGPPPQLRDGGSGMRLTSGELGSLRVSLANCRLACKVCMRHLKNRCLRHPKKGCLTLRNDTFNQQIEPNDSCEVRSGVPGSNAEQDQGGRDLPCALKLRIYEDF